MTDVLRTERGRAFLRAVCERPADDAPRLILADWLEEMGDADRAEFIRLQIHLEAACRGDQVWRQFLWLSPALEAGRPELRAAADRAGTLLARNREKWIWPVPELKEGRYTRDPQFRRGFMLGLASSGAALVRDARAIFSVQPITGVALTLWEGEIGGGRGGAVLYDADLTRRGERRERLPGPIFACLAEAGLPCHVQGVRAEYPEEMSGTSLVSRAAVAYGRRQAGLPPLKW
jgi:uncharacterized protein (TIGR02996 family)